MSPFKGIKVGALAVAGLLCAQVSFAIPSLQLDIGGAYYDTASETIIANGNPFTLYALYDGSKGAPSGTFRISAAIIPKTVNPPAESFGSFTINGNPYSIANMAYGTPPVEAILDKGELAPHGIFESHYAEFQFSFDLNNRAAAYNAEDSPGGLVTSASGDLYYQAFTIDIAGIAAGYNVHFDFYNLTVDKKTGTTIVDEFAPFSHDAQGGGTRVPDGSTTVLLLGAGMMALESFRRRFQR